MGLNRFRFVSKLLVYFFLSGTLFVAGGAIYGATQHGYVSYDDFNRSVAAIEEQQRVQDLDRSANAGRIAGIDSRVSVLERDNISPRLTRLETISNENQIYLRSMVVGVLLLLIEMVLRRVVNLKHVERAVHSGGGDD